MKSNLFKRGLPLLVLLLAVRTWAADPTWEYAVRIRASALQLSPPQITLSWPQDTTGIPISYTVSRKALYDASWGPGTVLPGTTTTFVDANVTAGTAYEYQIHKIASDYDGWGYIYAGMNLPLVENRGKVLLIVDNTYTSNLVAELARLQGDLIGDGWTVIRHDVSPSSSVASVKAFIQSQYYADPANVNSVFLFGHVPVPYSGNISPDEHAPDHLGAWPADVYYGDLDGSWTDYSVNNTGASDSRNWNVPGDGKFDQSYIPSTVELMVGRVDLSNLPGKETWDGPPTFPAEVELLRQYLNKDHNFRHTLISLPRHGLIYDGFGDYGGYAFSASAWRNFMPLLGLNNNTFLPDAGTWLDTLRNTSFLWAYGCGSSDYTSANGLGSQGTYYAATTTDLVQADPQAIFFMLFGSWFGDWDSEDNFQRAALATPTYGLVCCWSGSPHWFCQHMALGTTIGFSTRLTQNNGPLGLYRTQTNSYARQVHVALMGDPTLRMHPVGPPSGLVASPNGISVQLSWSPSYDSILGYHVYRATNTNGPFSRLTTSLLSAPGFIDASASLGTNIYMVRAVKLESTPSGTYSNLSQGIFVTASMTAAATRTSVSVSSILSDPAGMVLQWASLPGHIYRVAATPDLMNTNWSDLSTNLTATATSLSWTDLTARALSQRFYRVFEMH